MVVSRFAIPLGKQVYVDVEQAERLKILKTSLFKDLAPGGPLQIDIIVFDMPARLQPLPEFRVKHQQ